MIGYVTPCLKHLSFCVNTGSMYQLSQPKVKMDMTLSCIFQVGAKYLYFNSKYNSAKSPDKKLLPDIGTETIITDKSRLCIKSILKRYQEFNEPLERDQAFDETLKTFNEALETFKVLH